MLVSERSSVCTEIFWNAERGIVTSKLVILVGFMIDATCHPVIMHELLVSAVNNVLPNSVEQRSS